MRVIALATLLLPAVALAQAGSGPSLTPAPTAKPAPSTTTRPAEVTPTKSIDLRPRFERGQVLRYAIVVDGSTGANAASGTRPGAPSSSPTKTNPKPKDPLDAATEVPPVTSHWELSLDLKVKDRTDAGLSTIEATLAVVRAKIDAGGEVSEFDSTKPKKAPAGSQQSKPKNAPSNPASPAAALPDLSTDALLADLATPSTMTFTVDANGNVTNVTAGGGGLVGATKALPGTPDPSSLFRSIFTAAGAPGRANVGDSWTTQDTLDSGLLGQFKIANTNRLASATGARATVETKGTITPISEGRHESPVQLQNSTFTGTCTWDTGAGALESMQQTMVVRALMPIGESETSITQNSTMRVTRRP